MRKTRGKHSRDLLPYQTIASAAQGNPLAMSEVLAYYRPYMATLAKRETVDAEGNCHIGIDAEMMRRLEAKLTAKVLLFRAE